MVTGLRRASLEYGPLMHIVLTLAIVAALVWVGDGVPQAGGQPNAPAAPLRLADEIEVLGDIPVREPMVVEHPNGTLYVSGFGGRVDATLWQSRNGGKHWSRVETGGKAAGLAGNSDVDLAVAPDGTIYWANMLFVPEAREGVQITMAISRDAGATWSWSLISKRRFDDRPWVKIAPDGTAHVVWNDGAGVWHVASADRGASWTEPQRVHPAGGSSHLAVGPRGEVVVRITPRSASGTGFHDGVDLIAVSVDRGRTWTKRAAPGIREWRRESNVPLRRWVEPVAWDAAGGLYSAWTTPEAIWLARSSDRGATWQQWRIEQGGPIRYYPFLAARGRGEAAMTWFSGQGETLQAHVAVVRVAEDASQLDSVATARFRPDAWRRTAVNTDQFVRDTAGEYFPVAFLRDRTVAVVTPVQHEKERRFGFTWRRFQAR